MSSIGRQLEPPLSPTMLRRSLSLAVAGGAVVLGLVTVSQPLLAAGAAAACILGIVAMSAPTVATVAALFIVYSNVAVVAVRFHGMPKIAGQAVVLLLAVPLVQYVVFKRRRLAAHPLLPLMALYLAAQVLALMFSRDIEVSTGAIVEYLLEGMLIVFLVVNAVRTPRDLRWATWALLAAGLVMTAVPLYQQLTHSFDSMYGGFGQTNDIGFRTGDVTAQGSEVRQHRLSGTIGEQNRFAQATLVLVPLGLIMIGIARVWWAKLLALGLAGVAGIGCALAFSRGAAIAFVMTLGVLVAFRVVTMKHLAVVAVGAAVLLAAMPQYLTRLVTIQQVTHLVTGATPDEPTDGAITGRATEMLAAVQIFADHPVTGVGPGMFKFYSRQYGNRLGLRRLEENREAHSLYLGIAADTGLPGIACFMGMLAVTLLGLLRTRKRWADKCPELSNMAAAYFAAVVVLMMTGLWMHMAYIRFFYLILGMAAAVTCVAAAEANRREAPS